MKKLIIVLMVVLGSLSFGASREVVAKFQEEMKQSSYYVMKLETMILESTEGTDENNVKAVKEMINAAHWYLEKGFSNSEIEEMLSEKVSDSDVKKETKRREELKNGLKEMAKQILKFSKKNN